MVPYSVVVNTSRFAFDLNRPREAAIYLHPEDFWDLQVRKNDPPEDLIQRSLSAYDQFYLEMENLFFKIIERFGAFVVLDIYAYNHRRNGPDQPPENPQLSPDINIGTGTLDRLAWSDLIERLMADLRSNKFLGRKIDVRENVKFKGGRFPYWVNRKYQKKGVCIPIEIKKIYIDEWTGELDTEKLDQLIKTIRVSLFGLLNELSKTINENGQ